VRAVHERAVPNESKDEDETKRGEKCDKDFFQSIISFVEVVLNPQRARKASSQNVWPMSI